jgi:hypothetical protein
VYDGDGLHTGSMICGRESALSLGFLSTGMGTPFPQTGFGASSGRDGADKKVFFEGGDEMKTLVCVMMFFLWLATPAFGANSTNGNPRVIDTFGSDVTVFAGPMAVVSIVVEGATAGDTVVFINSSGQEVLRLSNTADGGSIVWTPAEPFVFDGGLIFDESASSLAENDFVFIFLK